PHNPACPNRPLREAPAYATSLQTGRPPLRRRLLAPDLAAGLNGHRPEAPVCAGYAVAPPGDALAGMIAADVAVLLPDDFLVKVDRASMAHGLEVRPPFLDHELLELSARLPSRYKVCRGETKWLLKQAHDDRRPRDILWRRKQGFDMPIAAWLRGPLREMFADAVLTPQARIGELLNQATVRRLFQAHQAGTGQHGSILWSVLILARWSERYL